MDEQQATVILQRYRSGDASPSENQLVDAWYQQLVNTGQWQWREGEREILEAAIQKQLLHRISRKHTTARIHLFKTTWFRYAAAVILIAGITISYFIINKSNNHNNHLISSITVQTIAPGTNKALLTIGDNKTINLSVAKTGITVNKFITYNDGEKIADAGQMLQLTTPRGGQYQAVLPDGSKVWLNAASSIRFPSKFEGNTRSIEVTGEAYLEVAPVRVMSGVEPRSGLRMPFVVHANGTTVQVLGTSFNINAYPNETTIKTTLIEGSIKMIQGNNEAILKPGQQSSYNPQSSGILVQVVNTEDAVSWKNGYFHFDKASIQDVMRQLSRWYDIEVVYENGIPNRVIGGDMQRNLNLLQVIKIIEKMKVHCTLEGKKLIVKN